MNPYLKIQNITYTAASSVAPKKWKFNTSTPQSGNYVKDICDTTE